MSGSSFHFGSLGSLENVPVTTPTELPTPAGTIVPAVEPEGKLMMIMGFQPISLDLRMASAANLPVPAMNRASALALLKLMIWDSIVGSDNSYDDNTTRRGNSSPKTALKALR